MLQVPQVNTSYTELSTGGAGQESNLMKAVNSIPAYVERSTHFLAIVPTVKHRDLPGVVCDLGSWLGRGWCKCHARDDDHLPLTLTHSLTKLPSRSCRAIRSFAGAPQHQSSYCGARWRRVPLHDLARGRGASRPWFWQLHVLLAQPCDGRLERR